MRCEEEEAGKGESGGSRGGGGLLMVTWDCGMGMWRQIMDFRRIGSRGTGCEVLIAGYVLQRCEKRRREDMEKCILNMTQIRDEKGCEKT